MVHGKNNDRIRETCGSGRMKLYWRFKKNGKWNWMAVQPTKYADQLGVRDYMELEEE